MTTRGRSRVNAQLRNLALRVMPERLMERKVRSFFDAEHPLAEVAASGYAS